MGEIVDESAPIDRANDAAHRRDGLILQPEVGLKHDDSVGSADSRTRRADQQQRAAIEVRSTRTCVVRHARDDTGWIHRLRGAEPNPRLDCHERRRIDYSATASRCTHASGVGTRGVSLKLATEAIRDIFLSPDFDHRGDRRTRRRRRQARSVLPPGAALRSQIGSVDQRLRRAPSRTERGRDRTSDRGVVACANAPGRTLRPRRRTRESVAGCGQQEERRTPRDEER